MMAVVARCSMPGHCGVACSRAFRPHEAAALHTLSAPSSSRRPFQMVSLQSSLILSDEHGGPPPGSPPTCMSLLITFPCHLNLTSPPVKYEGPWLSTQVMISLSVGMASFLIFSYSRRRWPLLFAPRTKLKGIFLDLLGDIPHRDHSIGFSPHEAHAHSAFLGWILPTLRMSEYSVLQIVGLDAAVVRRVQIRSRGVYHLMPLPALKLFQDVILSVLFVFGIRAGDSNAR
jgi:hypothetical protein